MSRPESDPDFPFCRPQTPLDRRLSPLFPELPSPLSDDPSHILSAFGHDILLFRAELDPSC